MSQMHAPGVHVFLQDGKKAYNLIRERKEKSHKGNLWLNLPVYKREVVIQGLKVFL